MYYILFTLLLSSVQWLICVISQGIHFLALVNWCFKIITVTSQRRNVSSWPVDYLTCANEVIRAPFQYPIRRLIVRSRKVSKARDRVLKCSYCFEIWQARSDNSKYKSRGFETLRDLTIRRLIGYWNGAQVTNGTGVINHNMFVKMTKFPLQMNQIQQFHQKVSKISLFYMRRTLCQSVNSLSSFDAYVYATAK